MNRCTLGWLPLLVAWPLSSHAQHAAHPAIADAPTAAAIYRDACASCHGPDGTGMPRSHVGFDVPLPDFSDCSFATREPDSDWFAVTHAGGPARGFDRRMPAFGRALGDEDIARSLAHVRSFCDDAAWPRGELNLPRPLVTEKAYPEDEAVVAAGAQVEGAAGFSGELVFERRFRARNQVEIVVPFQLGEAEAGRWRGGLGDIAVALKRAMYHSHERGTIVSLGAEAILPTGDVDDGGGSATTAFEPFISAGQILPYETFLHAQVGGKLPVDTDRAPREVFWRGVLGISLTEGRWGRAWSPMIELLGAREFVEGEPVQWDVVPQMQVTLSKRQHVMMNAGVRVPLTDSGPRRTELLVYLLWDWFDGGFREGW